jgi:hypothetical protein
MIILCKVSLNSFRASGGIRYEKDLAPNPYTRTLPLERLDQY